MKLCAFQAFLHALVSRPVRAHTREHLRSINRLLLLKYSHSGETCYAVQMYSKVEGTLVSIIIFQSYLGVYSQSDLNVFIFKMRFYVLYSWKLTFFYIYGLIEMLTK